MRIVRRFVVSIAMFCVVSTAFGAEWKLGEPIVTYYVAPKLSDAVAKQMAEGGWNLVWAWSEAELDVAHKHGLRAMFRHNLLIPGAKALDDPNKRKQLDALVDKVCKHPALYCYYVLDEPAAKDFPAVAQMVDYLRRRDPQHMAYVNLLPGGMVKKGLGTIADKAEYDKYQEYLDEFIRVVKPELLGYDRYQFAVAGVLEGYFQNLEQMRQTAQRAGLPFMNIVQACTWDAKLMRVPTDNEMRYLVYTTLAYGAQGISYYVYRYPGHEGGIATADGAPTSIYHVLKQANREFAAIATEYQSLRSLGAYHVGMQPAGARPLPKDAPFRLEPALTSRPVPFLKPPLGMLVGMFGPADQSGNLSAATHALVVNLNCTNDGVTTVIGLGELEVFDALERTWTPVSGQRVKLKLPPGGGKLVRIKSYGG